MARTAGLDVATIVRSALSIADRDGLDRLTMRRLSAELGVTPMAAYYHVNSKEELLDLVVDESIGQVPIVDSATNGVEPIVEWFVGLHDLLLDHPALAAATAGRRIDGPQAARAAIALTDVAARLCGDEDRAAEVVVAAFWLTLGSGHHRASRHSDPARSPHRSAPEDQARDLILARAVDVDQFRRSLTLLVAAHLGLSAREV